VFKSVCITILLLFKGCLPALPWLNANNAIGSSNFHHAISQLAKIKCCGLCPKMTKLVESNNVNLPRIGTNEEIGYWLAINCLKVWANREGMRNGHLGNDPLNLIIPIHHMCHWAFKHKWPKVSQSTLLDVFTSPTRAQTKKKIHLWGTIDLHQWWWVILGYWNWKLPTYRWRNITNQLRRWGVGT